MKTALAFLAGVATTWAALAIWQHRAVPDVDPADAPPVRPWSVPTFPEEVTYDMLKRS